jgi:hypothetical protein
MQHASILAPVSFALGKKSAAGQLGLTLARPIGSFIFYSLVTAVCFKTFIAHLDAALLGPPEDNLQDLWNSWYAAVGHTHQASFFFTNLIKFPEGTTLYYHSFAYPQVFWVWLGTNLFGTSLPTLTLLHNLGLILSFPLAGTGAFLLARQVTGSTWSAALGGFIFAFNPSHIEHAMHHMHVALIEFIPFFVLSYWLAIEKKSFVWLTLAISFHALAALSSWYYLFYCEYFVIFHTLIIAIQNRSLPRGWTLFAPLAATAGVIIVLSPLLVPMVREAVTIGAAVYADGSDAYLADVVAYFSFPPHHILASLTSSLYRIFSGDPWEATVYLGIGNIALCAWLFLNWRKLDRFNRQIIVYLLAAIALFVVLASGDHLRFLGHKILPMPDLVLADVPFFRNVRTPSRAIVFVYLFLAVLVSIAAQFLIRSSINARLLQRATVIGTLMLIAVDFYPTRLDITPFSCSSAQDVIRQDPETGFAVLNLPGGYVASNAAMAEQICHGRPIVQGMTARQLTPTLRDFLETGDLEKQRRQLVAAKVKYVILRRADNEIYSWQDLDGVRIYYLQFYPTVYADPEFSILQVY